MDTIRTDITEEDRAFRIYAAGKLRGGWEVVLFDSDGNDFLVAPLGKVNVNSEQITNAAEIRFGYARYTAKVDYFGVRVVGCKDECHYSKFTKSYFIRIGDNPTFQPGNLNIDFG